MKSEEVIYQKVYVSPRAPPTICYKDNWTCDLDSDIARSSNDIQRVEQKPNTELSSTGKLVTRWREESLERTEFDHDTLSQERHDEVTDSTSTGRPVCGQESTEEIEKQTMFDHEDVIDSTSTGRPVCGPESTKRCFLTPRHVENNQTGTEKPVTVDQKEGHKIDFRVPGLSHSVVKEAEHLRVQELVKRIETHPHRAALHADLQQNDVYNPFSKDSKEMIRELGNVEFFELCETTPKVQCSHCLLYWNQGIVYGTCGQCLIDSESRRNFHRIRLDALSIPNDVIKKLPDHGARHGKTEEQKEYHMAWNAWKRCCKKVDSQGEDFTGIHYRFIRDPVYRESQLAIGWTEQKRKE